MPHESYLTDSQFDFSSGVDSSAITTVRSALVPHGLPRDKLAWLNGGTVRNGIISPRLAYIFNKRFSDGKAGLYQGGFLYEPIDGSNPYFIIAYAGQIYRFIPDTGAVTNLSASGPNLTMPANLDYFYFSQGEEFLVIQAGDFVTLPLFWDGTKLRRSKGAPQSVGVTAADFTAPGVGHHADDGSGWLTLTAPYSGDNGEIVTINGAQYVQIQGNNNYQLTNVSAGPVGGTIVAGTTVFKSGVFFGHIMAPVTIPALGAAVFFAIDTPTISAGIGDLLTINGSTWQVLTTGAPALGPNQVILLNLTDTPGTLQKHPAVLLSLSELPAAAAMDYYMDRLWYAQGRTYGAGDIVKGPSGTVQYGLRDSILRVTENPLCIGGDNFTVPDNAGNIRALKHSAQLDAALGQGRLYIFTRKRVYAQIVPVTRTDWISADTNNQPEQTVVQLTNGAVNDRGVVAVNGDLYYQSLDPAIRSLFLAVRYFGQPGNIPISREEDRLMRFVNRGLMRFGSGIEFGNRMLQATLPIQLATGQVVNTAIAPLDFDIISTMQERLPPSWEGHWEGLQFLQLFSGDFGGLERGFALVVSQLDGGIDLWELVDGATSDVSSVADPRIQMEVEFPAFEWSNIREFKQLAGGELWVDRVIGTVDLTVWYRPDAAACWVRWFDTSFCSAKNCTEDVRTPCAYPLEDNPPGYRWPITFPEPPAPCIAGSTRPANLGFQFQVKVTVTGYMRIRGLIVYAAPKLRGIYEGLAC